MAEIILTEWQASTITLSAPDVRYLVTLAERNGSPFLTLTPRGGDEYLAQANHHVGLLRLPSGRTLEIRPKVPIGNIVAMLNVVNDLGAFLPTLTGADTFTAFFSILIDQFITALEILTHGLLRGFTTQQEQSTTIRGKLNLSETLRQAPSIRHHSEAPDTTSEVLENQLLRLACDKALRRLPLSAEQETRLRSLSKPLHGISIEGISREAVRRVQFNRLNEHYRPVLALAELLLFDQSPTSSGTRTQQPSFLVDMNQLFERYTALLLKRGSEDRYGVTSQATHNLDRDGQLTVRPDVILQPRHGSAVPIDIKYKTRLHNADIYQVLAYCHALQTSQAVLIYANALPTQQFVIAHGEGMKIVIVVLGLDLAGDVTIMQESETHLVEAMQQIVDARPQHKT